MPPEEPTSPPGDDASAPAAIPDDTPDLTIPETLHPPQEAPVPPEVAEVPEEPEPALEQSHGTRWRGSLPPQVDWPIIPPPPPTVLPAAAASPAPAGVVATGSEDVNLRGVLRWLLFEADGDAAGFLQVAPGGEQLFIEPRGLADAAVSDLARRAREAMVAGPGERAAADVSTARWLGVGGSKLLIITGASPLAAAEPIRFARFAIEWLAGSRAGGPTHPSESVARTVPGVAWAEMGSDERMRVLPSEQYEDGAADGPLARVLPGLMVHWVVAGRAATEQRARLVDVNLTDVEGAPSAEVRLLWEGSELRGIGRGHTSLVGRYLAAARAAIDALKPLVHGVMHVEHLQVSTLPSDVEVVLVSVLVGEERLVGATLVRPDEEARAGAKAVLDALNRRLVVLAGQSGQI
jgi:hypothetical protein